MRMARLWVSQAHLDGGVGCRLIATQIPESKLYGEAELTFELSQWRRHAARGKAVERIDDHAVEIQIRRRAATVEGVPRLRNHQVTLKGLAGGAQAGATLHDAADRAVVTPIEHLTDLQTEPRAATSRQPIGDESRL